jgi:hypothetical protein
VSLRSKAFCSFLYGESDIGVAIWLIYAKYRNRYVDIGRLFKFLSSHFCGDLSPAFLSFAGCFHYCILLSVSDKRPLRFAGGLLGIVAYTITLKVNLFFPNVCCDCKG